MAGSPASERCGSLNRRPGPTERWIPTALGRDFSASGCRMTRPTSVFSSCPCSDVIHARSMRTGPTEALLTDEEDEILQSFMVAQLPNDHIGASP
jgi:hypothetical protein